MSEFDHNNKLFLHRIATVLFKPVSKIVSLAENAEVL